MDSIKIKREFDLFFPVPLEIGIGKKNKKFILNQNKYRNAHWRELADAKKNFNDLVRSMNLNTGDEGFPFQSPVQFCYDYFPKTKRSYDRMNVLSIVDKFVCDALIECGILIDDNYRMVLTPHFLHCGVDRKNPRCGVYIKEVK